MRALILLLLVVLAFLLVVKFYPASTVEGGVDSAAGSAADAPAILTPDPDQAPARFLQREEPATAIETPAPARPAVSEPVSRPESSVPEWLARVEAPPVTDEGELAIASAVLHRGPDDVVAAVRAVDGFPPPRAIAVEAFSRALAGDTRVGLRLAAGIDEGDLEGREKELLQASLGAKTVRARPLTASRSGPLLLAMEMRLAEAQGLSFLAQDRSAEAARSFSDLLVAELAAPWPADPQSLARWSASLDAAQALHRWNRRGEWPAEEVTVEPGDSLVAIRKRYLARHPGRVTCVGLIRRVNGIPANGYIQPGQTVRIPTEPVSVLVDLSARWTLLLIGDEVAGSWPVGIGKEGEETPPGEYAAKDKIPEPAWLKVGQEPIPYGDARNPLGTRWIGWYQDGIKTSYGFHGTTEPESIGHPSSDGCVRFHDEDVELLFEMLPEGAPILVRE